MKTSLKIKNLKEKIIENYYTNEELYHQMSTNYGVVYYNIRYKNLIYASSMNVFHIENESELNYFFTKRSTEKNTEGIIIEIKQIKL